MSYYQSCAIAKPEPRKRVKARLQRLQAKADRLIYAAVDARDGQCCRVCRIYCGRSIHRHHVVYRSQGGPTTVENLLSVCEKCHRGIHEKRIEVAA